MMMEHYNKKTHHSIDMMMEHYNKKHCNKKHIIPLIKSVQIDAALNPSTYNKQLRCRIEIQIHTWTTT